MIDLGRFAGRPTLLAVAAMNAITGIAAAAILAPLSFGGDVDVFRRGAAALEHGAFATDFLYSPLAGLLLRPLIWMSDDAASVLMTAIGLVVLVAGVLFETRGHAVIDRILVLIAAATFVPVVNDLLLGQVTLLIAAALYPAVRRADAPINGIALGAVIALAPKPLLIPILLWMAYRRPRALLGALGSAVVLTLIGALLMGPATYGLWVDALVTAGRTTREGNLSVWGLGSTALAAGLAIAGIVAATWAVLRSEQAGLVAAVLVGLVIAPYTLLYSASIVLVVVVPALAVSPVATRILAVIANPAVLGAFIPWALGGIAAMAAAARRRAPATT